MKEQGMNYDESLSGQKDEKGGSKGKGAFSKPLTYFLVMIAMTLNILNPGTSGVLRLLAIVVFVAAANLLRRSLFMGQETSS